MEQGSQVLTGVGWKIAAAALGIPVAFLSTLSIPEKCITSIEAVKTLVSMYSSATVKERIKGMLEQAGEEYNIRFVRVDGLSDNELHEAYLSGMTEEELFIIQWYSKFERDKLLDAVVANSHQSWRNELALILCFGYTSTKDEAIKTLLSMAVTREEAQWTTEGSVSFFDFEENPTDNFYGSIELLEVEEGHGDRCQYYTKDDIGWARIEMEENGVLTLRRASGSRKLKRPGKKLREFFYVQQISRALETSCGIRDNVPLSWTLLACLSNGWTKDFIEDLESVMKTTIWHFQQCCRKVRVNAHFHELDEVGDNRLARSLIVYNKEQRGVIHDCRGQPERQKFLKHQFELKSLEFQSSTEAVPGMICARDLFKGAEDYPDILYKLGTEIMKRAARSDIQPTTEKAVLNKFDMNIIALFRRYSRTVHESNLFQNIKKRHYYYNQDENSISIRSAANQAFFHYSREDIHVDEEGDEQPFVDPQDSFLKHVSRMLFSEYEENTPILRNDDHELTQRSATMLKRGVHYYLQLRASRLGWMAENGQRLTVSGVRTTAEAVTKITGISTPWIVREILAAMHRRGIAFRTWCPLGTSFGDTIVILCHLRPKDDAKALVYDEAIDMAGCEYQISEGGKINLHLNRDLNFGLSCCLWVRSRSNSQTQAKAALLNGRGELRVSNNVGQLSFPKRLGKMLVK